MIAEELGRKLFEAYRIGMLMYGVEVEEEWDELQDADQHAWTNVARVARKELAVKKPRRVARR